MNSRGLVSVIIPVYNVRPYLEEALDSVLRQSHRNLEILLIDDGSTDGSGELCDVYAKKDGRVHVLHRIHKGLSAARNAGLDAMTGDAVAFLDADDAYAPGFVEETVSAMAREGADLVICRFTSHPEAGPLRLEGSEKPSPSIATGNYDRPGILRALADGTVNISVWNKLYARELWKTVRFPEGHVYEDVDVAFGIFSLCRSTVVLDRPLVLHRRRAGSISGTCSEENIRDRDLADSHFAAFLEQHTPELFTPGQLEHYRRTRLKRMLQYYLGYIASAKKPKNPFARELRERILDYAKTAELRGCPLRARAVYHVLRICPVLLMIYPLYRSVRHVLHRL